MIIGGSMRAALLSTDDHPGVSLLGFFLTAAVFTRARKYHWLVHLKHFLSGLLSSRAAHIAALRGRSFPCRASKLPRSWVPDAQKKWVSTSFAHPQFSGSIFPNTISWLSEILAMQAWHLSQVSTHTPTESCLNIIIEELCRSIWIQWRSARRQATAKTPQWWQQDRSLFLAHLVVWAQAVLLDTAVPERQGAPFLLLGALLPSVHGCQPTHGLKHCPVSHRCGLFPSSEKRERREVQVQFLSRPYLEFACITSPSHLHSHTWKCGHAWLQKRPEMWSSSGPSQGLYHYGRRKGGYRGNQSPLSKGLFAVNYLRVLRANSPQNTLVCL